ncbi:hypothetical protein X768_04470 [Mesorhizobium sp. LSJC265A00]|nr:hypothetical protein X768_04470 [Mesorhizobium sp. LSJC265A00]ESX40073.1 hypothetical protein X763_04800 [Mesorhizobium sp. LSHC432A00]
MPITMSCTELRTGMWVRDRLVLKIVWNKSRICGFMSCSGFLRNMAALFKVQNPPPWSPLSGGFLYSDKGATQPRSE